MWPKRKSIRIGVIGAGQIGQMCHVTPLQRCTDCRVVALADLRPDLLAAAAKIFDVPKQYASHRDLLADGEIDGVVVVTNRAATGPIVRDALLSGRAVLSEKPMAHTVGQADELVRCSKKAGVPLSIGYMKRHDPAFQLFESTLERLRSEGALGAMVAVQAHSLAGDTCRPAIGFAMTPEPRPEGLEVWPTAPDWLAGPTAAQYASFLNVHIHAINWLRRSMGRLEVIKARNSDGRYDIDLAAGGVPVRLVCQERTKSEWSEGMTAFFEGGNLSFALTAPFASAASGTVSMTTEGRKQTLDVPPGWSFDRQANWFVDVIRGAAMPAVEGVEAVGDCALAESVWRVLR